MEFSDWLLFLHVLSAFVVVGSLTALWALVIATRPSAPILAPEEAKRFGNAFGPAVGAGLMGTLVFGIWLALDSDSYGIFDGWIIAALVVWAFGGWAGGEAGKRFSREPVPDRTAGVRFQTLSSLAVVVILILMIWKPGA